MCAGGLATLCANLRERLQLRPTAPSGRRAPADTAGGLGRRRLLVTIESAAACGATVMPQRAGCGCRAALTGDGVSLGPIHPGPWRSGQCRLLDLVYCRTAGS